MGEMLPAMPLFVAEGMHVKVPLETTYQTTWAACPEAMREAVETGIMSEPDGDAACRGTSYSPNTLWRSSRSASVNGWNSRVRHSQQRWSQKRIMVFRVRMP